MSRRWMALWGLLAVTGCTEELSEASELTYARVLGVRVEAEGEPRGRAAIHVDEAARATLLVRGPEGATPVSYAMVLCLPFGGGGTLPTCAPNSELAAIVEPTASADPSLSWERLDASVVGDAPELLLLGTICEQGVPDIASLQPGACKDPTFQGVTFFAHVSVASDVAVNHNPNLDGITLRLDGRDWAADPANEPLASCMHLPRDGKEHALEAVLASDAREDDDNQPETLLLSWFASHGGLSQHFTVVESDQPTETPQTLTYTAPKAPVVATDGVVTLVVRDQRGGVAWVERTLCFD